MQAYCFTQNFEKQALKIVFLNRGGPPPVDISPIWRARRGGRGGGGGGFNGSEMPARGQSENIKKIMILN